MRETENIKNYLRKFTRIFAIPFILIIWFCGIIQTILWFILCLFDLSPEEWEIFFDLNITSTIKDYLKNGVDEL